MAAATGISGKLILRWVNMADLFRVGGVGEEYSDLLEASGVDTVPELAQRRADNLTTKLAEVSAQKQLVRRLPTESQVSSWIEFAKSLPRVVIYWRLTSARPFGVGEPLSDDLQGSASSSWTGRKHAQQIDKAVSAPDSGRSALWMQVFNFGACSYGCCKLTRGVFGANS